MSLSLCFSDQHGQDGSQSINMSWNEEVTRAPLDLCLEHEKEKQAELL